jgi:hypothetical protein
MATAGENGARWAGQDGDLGRRSVGLALTADGAHGLPLTAWSVGSSARWWRPGQAGALNGRAGEKAHRGNISANSRARSRRRSALNMSQAPLPGARFVRYVKRVSLEWMGAAVGVCLQLLSV